MCRSRLPGRVGLCGHSMCGCSWALLSSTPGSLRVLGLEAKTLIFSLSQLPWRPGREMLRFPEESHRLAAIRLSDGDLPAHRPGGYQNFPFICIFTPAGLQVGRLSPLPATPYAQGSGFRGGRAGEDRGPALGGRGVKTCRDSPVVPRHEPSYTMEQIQT